MTFTLYDLPVSERPRERMQLYGSSSLSVAELLALILSSGTRGESVTLMAQKLLSRFGSLEGIIEASLQDMQSIRGLGVAKSTQLKACFELAKRISRENKLKNKTTQAVVSPEGVFNVVKDKIEHFSKEQFMVLSFDSRHHLIALDTIFIGSLNASVVHPREVFDAAIHRHAACIIIVHNHPSGNVQPSEEDIKVTKSLVDAGKIMGIDIVDHVIVTEESYLSMKREKYI